MIPSGAYKILMETTPEALADKQLHTLNNQTVILEHSLKEIERLNNQVLDLQNQLKEESKKNEIALKKEHRFTIICSFIVGTVCAIIGAATGHFFAVFF